MLNRCISDNKSKDTSESDWDYCIKYNYEYLEDYQEEDGGNDYDSLFSFGSDETDHVDDDDKPE